MATEHEEERLLRSVVRQNAESIFLARQRAERDLLDAKEALEARSAELAASLAMMQATLEATADGILVTDEAGRVTGHNGKFVDMWRIPPDVLASNDHRRLLTEMSSRLPDPADHMAGVEAILALAPADTFDVQELSDGRVFERCTRVQMVADRIIGRVWSYRDVTERARSEAALREAKAQAEAASRAKSTFLAMMSHELRTPLNAIAGYAQLIEMEIHGDITLPQRRAIERIQASQRHLLGLIDEVLIHAKLETGTVRYELGAVRVKSAVADAESLIAPQAWTKGVTLQMLECDPHLRVHADAERVQQILVNLLSNAIKFTPRGGLIEIGCAAAGTHVSIMVHDTGVGIAADDLDLIFEPFVQAHSDLTRTAEGTGLGLAISRSLARDMDGDLTVRSTPGRGSTFTLSLPAPAV